MSVRRASKAASRSGSSSSSSGPCSSSRRSYRARRAVSPCARASATSRKSCARRRPRTLARIMPKPPSSPATPRPAPELLARLTTLAQELAGAFPPATVIEAVARALAELLKPDRLSGILLYAESNPPAGTHDTHPRPGRTHDPPPPLALHRGPLPFPQDAQGETPRRRGAPRQPRVRPPDSGRGHGDPRPPMDRPPATRLVGPRGACHHRAVGEYGGDPRRGARAAADRHTHGRAGLGGPRVRGPDGAAPAAGAAHTV